MRPEASATRCLGELRQNDWPADIAAAWVQRTSPHPASFRRRHRPKTAATLKIYGRSLGAFLWHLEALGQLDHLAPITDLVTLEHLDQFFERMQSAGNRDYTILSRFKGLHGALRLLFPDIDFRYVVRPDGVPLKRCLAMTRRTLFIPDARHNLLWAERLFREALDFGKPLDRQLQVRDAAIIAILAEAAPRARAMQALRIGQNLSWTGTEWILLQEGAMMKNVRTVIELPLSRRTGTIVTRYLGVERGELLRDHAQDALWITIHGNQMSDGALESMVLARSKAEYGVAFSLNRFRHSLTTTKALFGDRLFDAALILGHGARVNLENYNRAGNIEAARRHDARISEMEDAAERLLATSTPLRLMPEPSPATFDVASRGRTKRRSGRHLVAQMSLFEVRANNGGNCGRSAAPATPAGRSRQEEA